MWRSRSRCAVSRPHTHLSSHQGECRYLDEVTDCVLEQEGVGGAGYRDTTKDRSRVTAHYGGSVKCCAPSPLLFRRGGSAEVRIYPLCLTICVTFMYLMRHRNEQFTNSADFSV